MITVDNWLDLFQHLLGRNLVERHLVVLEQDPLEVALQAQVPCGGPEDLVLGQSTIDSTTELVGCLSVTLGPELDLTGTADAAVRAGLLVRLDGVSVAAGARLRIGTDPSLLIRESPSFPPRCRVRMVLWNPWGRSGFDGELSGPGAACRVPAR